MILAQGEEALFIMKQGHAGGRGIEFEAGSRGGRGVEYGVFSGPRGGRDISGPRGGRNAAHFEASNGPRGGGAVEMGPEEVGAQSLSLCLAHEVEGPSYQRVPCGPTVELVTQGHVEEGA